jgi:LmbE family N-acetylglucosaminyl deacetylase
MTGSNGGVGVGPAPLLVPGRSLPEVHDVLAVCAHPDDESFGLGALLAGFSERGSTVRVLCFTHGEASTLGLTGRPLGEVRARELRAAADVLGVTEVELLSYPDGRLSELPLQEAEHIVARSVRGADLVLVFDEGGITGHPDHCRATEAALGAASRSQVPVLAWALPEKVAAELNREFGTCFVGRADAEIDLSVKVDRERQHAAVACHVSQVRDNPVLRRRLDLLGPSEKLRWLSR